MTSQDRGFELTLSGNIGVREAGVKDRLFSFLRGVSLTSWTHNTLAELRPLILPLTNLSLCVPAL